MILAALGFGAVAVRLRLPKVTAYLLAGVAIGPVRHEMDLARSGPFDRAAGRIGDFAGPFSARNLLQHTPLSNEY